MIAPNWLGKELILSLHDRSIALHGGAPGLRDEGLLDSALVRPQNLLHYEGEVDIVRLAASYAVSICANHPFFDGNKRSAFFAMGVFLEKNGFYLEASQSDAALTILALAGGKIGEADLTRWLRSQVRPI
jgi:death-on-curing protein